MSNEVKYHELEDQYGRRFVCVSKSDHDLALRRKDLEIKMLREQRNEGTKLLQEARWIGDADSIIKEEDDLILTALTKEAT